MITTNGDRAILDGPEPTDEGFLEIDARGHRVFYRVFGGGRRHSWVCTAARGAARSR